MLRVVIAVGLLAGAVLASGFDSLMLALLAIPIATTAVRGQCWLYRWYGVSTRRRPEGMVCDADRCRLR